MWYKSLYTYFKHDQWLCLSKQKPYNRENTLYFFLSRNDYKIFFEFSSPPFGVYLPNFHLCLGSVLLLCLKNGNQDKYVGLKISNITNELSEVLIDLDELPARRHLQIISVFWQLKTFPAASMSKSFRLYWKKLTHHTIWINLCLV